MVITLLAVSLYLNVGFAWLAWRQAQWLKQGHWDRAWSMTDLVFWPLAVLSDFLNWKDTRQARREMVMRAHHGRVVCRSLFSVVYEDGYRDRIIL